MLTVQFLKRLTTTVVLKELTLRGRHRRSRGNPINSRLPRHGVRIRTKKTQQREKKKKQKQNQGQIACSYKDIDQKLYDA